MRIVIFGGHGKVALHLAPLLVRDGHTVTSCVRNADHVDDVAATGATPVVVDLESATTSELTALLDGHDAVVWSAGAGSGSPAWTEAVDHLAATRSMDAAVAAGVDRYVMVSYFGAGFDHGVPEGNSFRAYADAKAAADDHLRRSGLAWTILGPRSLTLEPGTGRIEVGGATGTSVPREDVAGVAAAVIARPGTVGHVIDFNHGDTPIAEALDAWVAAEGDRG